MKQSILNAGDLVKYHSETDAVDAMGFKLGQFYRIELLDGMVVAVNGPVNVPLFDRQGEPSQYADFFTKHHCPVTLSRGV